MVIKEDMYSNVQKMEDLIIDTLGTEEALNAIIKALDVDTKNDIYEYIIRVYDLSNGEDIEEGLNNSKEFEFDGYTFDPNSPWTQIWKDVIQPITDDHFESFSRGLTSQEEMEDDVDARKHFQESEIRYREDGGRSAPQSFPN